MILIAFLITIIYSVLIGCFIIGFDKIKSFNLENIKAKTKFTVIIPFRNEADNLPALLQSIEAFEYPKPHFEIIFVDDASIDHSVKTINKWFADNSQADIQIIKNERKTNSPKKDAITTAINHSKNDWILTTDADCILPQYWLNSFNEYIQKTNTICIAAPVTYNATNTFLSQFQLLDFLSLQGATIGGFGIKKPFLCNGANFGYKKDAFHQLNGFEGNTNIASGDDIFLLEKVLKHDPKQLHYLKSKHAIVTTKPQQSVKTLIAQRLRWASKTSHYNNPFGKITGLIVLLMNAFIIAITIYSFLGFFNIKTLLYILCIKLNIDFLLIYKTALFFNQKAVLKSYLFAMLIYPLFSVYIAFISTFKSYTWKDRSFKK
ncbi:MAG: glycosyltransferase [Algibacter sp.]